MDSVFGTLRVPTQSRKRQSLSPHRSDTIEDRRPSTGRAKADALRGKTPSMTPAHEINVLYDEIRRKMKRREETHRMFICESDLIAIWRSIDSRSLFPCEKFDEEEMKYINKHCYKVVSILIFIRAFVLIKNFRKILLPSGLKNRDRGLNDRKLPLEDKHSDMLRFLEFEDISLSVHFIETQHCFTPVKIQEEVNQRTITLSSRHRLPFIYTGREVGTGGYGKVDQITIPWGYLTQKNGAMWPSDRAIACKVIKGRTANMDFTREVNNLQILKESVTSHRNVMTHLATIVHGDRYIILLPLAELGDLESLLNEGISVENELLYRFGEKFPGLAHDDGIGDILEQNFLVSDAIRWLHYDLRVANESDIFICHMDLKPANILIRIDERSKVGRWVLSDFGVSVFRERVENSPESQNTVVLSIRDAYNQIRSKTRPKRYVSDYIAPEVLPNGSSSVGRKSDVWSMGCVMSEIAAFALGRRALVQEFRSLRNESETGGYFYTTRSELDPSGTTVTTMEVSFEILEWLRELPAKFPNKGPWLNCYIEMIVNCLTISIDDRPDAYRLRETLKHTQDTFSNPHTHAASVCPSPNFPGEHAIDMRRSHSSESRNTIEFPPPSRSTSSNSHQTPGTLLDPMGKFISSSNPGRTYVFSVIPDLKNPAIDVAITPAGDMAAWLFSDTIRIFKLRLDSDRFEALQPIKLPTNATWRRIIVSGNYLAVKGTSENLFFCSLKDQSKHIAVPDRKRIITMRNFALSRTGIVVLVCGSKLIMRQIDHNHYAGVSKDKDLVADPGHSFCSAVFSPSGRYLFAWSYGSGPDKLHTYDLRNLSTGKVTQPYQSPRHGNQILSLVPFESIQACIAQEPEVSPFKFFVCQPSIDEPDRIPKRAEFKLDNRALFSTVYRNVSLMTVEKGALLQRRGAVLRERVIEDDQIYPKETTICKLSSNVTKESRMTVSNYMEKAVTMIVNVDGTVERVPVSTM